MSSINEKIKCLEGEIEQLSDTLEAKRDELRRLRQTTGPTNKINESSLTNEEISRFSRQIILPEVGVKGQIKLRNAKVLIVGAGGLGKLIEFNGNDYRNMKYCISMNIRFGFRYFMFNS